MSELEGIIANMQSDGRSEAEIQGVIENFDEQNKKFSFIPDTIVAETTRNTDTVIVPEIIQGQDQMSEQELNKEFAKIEAERVKEEEERKKKEEEEAKLQRELSKVKFKFEDPNLGGKGLVDQNQGAKKQLKNKIKNTSVVTVEHQNAVKQLEDYREQEFNSNFSTQDYKNVEEIIKNAEASGQINLTAPTKKEELDKLVAEKGNYTVDSHMGQNVYTFEDGTTVNDAMLPSDDPDAKTDWLVNYEGIRGLDAQEKDRIKKFTEVGPAGHSKLDIYKKAIANMKVDTPVGGYGQFEERDVDLSEFEDWQLLDGLDFEQIQQFAGISYSDGFLRGDDVVEKNSFDKKNHINNLARKFYKLDNEVVNEQHNDVLDDFEALGEEVEKHNIKGETLKGKIDKFNTTFTPVAEKYDKAVTDIEASTASVDGLLEELNSIPRPTKKGLYSHPAHVSSYNKAVNNYQTAVTNHNSLIAKNKPLFDEYGSLIKENEALQAESAQYNEELGNINRTQEDLNNKQGELEVKRKASQEKYGLTIADGILKNDKERFTNIKAYEDWRKTNKIENSIFDKDAWLSFGQGMGKTWGKMYTGGQLFALRGLDAVTGGAFSRGDEYTNLDYLEDVYDKFSNYDLVGVATDEDYGEEGPSGLNYATKVVAEGLPFMLAIANGGGLMSGSSKIAQGINMSTTGFQLTAMDNVLEGEKMGLSRTQATMYGGIIGTTIGLTQLIMPDSKILQGTGINEIAKKGLGDIFKRGLTKEATKFAVGNWFKRNLGEIVEEEVEAGMEHLAKKAFNLSHESDFLNWKTHQKLIADTWTLTGITGLSGSTADYNNFRSNAFTQLKGDVNPMITQINEQVGEIQKKINKAERINDGAAIKKYTDLKNDLLNSKQYVTNFKNALNVAPENVSDQQLEDLTEKMRLLELKKNQDSAFHGGIDLQIKKINEKIENSVVEQTAKETNEKLYKQTLATVKTLAEGQGDAVQEFENDKEVNKYLEDNGVKSKFEKTTYGGFVNIDGVKTLLINKQASQKGEGVNVASHEFLHRVLQTTFAKKDADGNPIIDADGEMVIDKKAAIGIGQSLGKWISEIQGDDFANSKLLERLQSSYSGELNNVQAQEVLTLLSDSIVTGDLKFEENIFTRLGDVIRRGLQERGFADIKFNTAKDVYNFVKDYNASIAAGGLNQAQEKLMKEGAKVGGEIAQTIDSDIVDQLAKEDSIEERMNLLAENGIDPNSVDGKALLASKASDVASLLDKFDGPRDMITRTLMETKDGQQVMDIKNRSGEYVDNPFVRSEFGQEIAPITETITKRLFDPIPQNLRAGVTRGQFMNELTSMAAGLVENEYDASKQDIDKFISNRLNLRANKLASDLGIESTVEEGGLGASVSLDAAAELTTEQTGPVNENTPASVLVDRLATTEQKQSIEKAIQSKIKGNTIEVSPGKFTDISNLNYKTLKNLVAPEVASMFGIEAVENYTSPTKTLKNDDVVRARMFIGKNADIIYNSLPKGVTASGTATGLKQVISKNFYTKSDTRVKYDAKEGGAGIFPQIKNKMTGKEFAAIFGYEKGKLTSVKGQNPATLISGLMDEVGKTITNQTVRQQLDKMNTAGDKEVAARIALLGDGKSDVMFSQAALSKLSPEKHVTFLDKATNINAKMINAAGGNMTNVLNTHFADDIKNGTYDIGKQSTEQLINKVGKTLQGIYDGMTDGKSLPPDFVYDGNKIADMVIDQFVTDNIENELKSYESIAGEKIQGLTTVEGIISARNAAVKLGNRFAKKKGKAWVKKFIAPGLSASARAGRGEFVFKPGTMEYKIDKTKQKSRNRFGLGNAADIGALLGVTDIKITNSYNTGDVKAHEGKLTVVPSQSNLTNIVKENQEANQAYRDFVAELKDMYNNKEISKSDVVALLQAMNSNPRGLTRTAAILDFIPDGKFDGKLRLEHMTPALQVNLNALNHILNGTPETDQNFKDIMDGYKAAYLPIKYDNMVNELYKSTLPIYADPKTPSIVRYYNPEIPGFDLVMKQLSTGNKIGQDFVFSPKQQAEMRKNNTKAVKGSKLYFSKASDSNVETNRKNTIIDRAVKQARLVAEPRGITVLDFDDTLATTESLVKYTKPDGTTGTLNAEQYASTYQDLLDQGYTFDFSEFNKVVKGKLAPLFQKALKLQGKFGPDNMFVLTARPPAAQKAIFDFLKANGLNIPIKNITGLANSTSEAKALWVADKVGDGYNDFYFADDALQNVQAVDNMLEQFDVKRKVQQAKTVLFSKASEDFNQILEDTSGVNRFAEFSDAKAQKRGANKGKYNIFIPASAEDFKGLLYNFLGKGKKGEAHMEFFNDALVNPFSRAIKELDGQKARIANDYKALIKMLPDAKKLLNKTIPEGDFTYDTAVRVYNWTQQGLEIKGLSKGDTANLIKAVENNPALLSLAKGLDAITKGYPEPGDFWMTETILSDLNNMTEGVSRADALAEFIQNREQIFGEWENGKLVGPNMNKIEAIHGTRFREALTDMLWRMENGTNRAFGNNRLTNRFANWVNNSVGAIMFFNMRSAALQTLSTVNFVNWSDNNILAAGKAFANQKQYWKDFTELFNSDMLKQRRSGLKTSVSHSELAEAASGSKGSPKAVFQHLLRLGFLPTQIADSFAIAAGGATFYRNRINSLVKNGMSEAEAKKQAFNDFQQIAEETQQSSRPDMISQQQASPLGRLILAFQNTPMQYTRLTKKAILDLVNGRGDAKTHVSKILYYGAAQNLIFSALQKAMFAAMFDDEDDEEAKKRQDKKEKSLLNSILDSTLRGMGVGGAVVSTLKNMIIRFLEEDEKGWNADFDKVIVDFLNLSPPVGSKVRKLKSGFSTYQFNKEVIDYMPKNDIDNPMWETVGNVVSAITNVPMDRLVNKTNNVREAFNNQNETWQRIALMMGWNRWDIGVEKTKVKEVKAEIKELKEIKKKEKDKKKKEEKKKQKEKERKEKEAREVQCSAKIRKGKGPRCKNRTENKNGKCYAHQ